jgi:hypothetical protein
MPAWAAIAAEAGFELRRLARRAGWAGALGAGLIVSALVGGMLGDRLVDEAGRDLAREAARLKRAQEVSAADRGGGERERLERFYATRFPGESQLEARLGALYAAAAAHGIVIRRADYRVAAEPATPLQRVALALPVQGEFARIHAWLSAALVAMPELALEGISIKRAGSEARATEAELRFVLFVGAGR